MNNPMSSLIRHIKLLSDADKAVKSLREMQYEQLVSKKRHDAVETISKLMRNPDICKEDRDYLSKISINDITTYVDVKGATLFHIINKNIKGGKSENQQ